ncbi:MAG: pyridoxamine 5'-phosphate oxidase family protein [Candidatus Heimdallarchaeota archaeon]
MNKYHLRRSEKAIQDEHELLEILQKQQVMTLAMAHENTPYLVTMNYVFEKSEKCLYFHCAKEGKKIEFLDANPVVWGQILEDQGYLDGKCDYAYRSIHFEGSVEFLTEVQKKRKALLMLIDHFEQNPEELRKKYIQENQLARALVGKIIINGMSGKKSTGS